jgi:D-alanyl-D-alanine carboxypeptidase/D-alanyl-D-alanine-endopeptidase (penicillin-binding protein 4)
MFFGLPGLVDSQPLPEPLQKAWRQTGLSTDAVSLMVKELNGPVLFAINPEVPRNPASVMKMVTTWAALSELGPDYQWRTAFYYDGLPVPDEQGSLPKPLYLKASGDPFLQVEELWALLRELRLRGVKNLTDVVVDRSIFGAVAIDPGAFDEAPDRPYNASPDAMMVGLGAVRLSFQPDYQARKWIPVVDPPVRGIRVQGEVAWSDAACPGSPRVSTQVIPDASGTVVQVGGTAAGSCGEFSVYRLAMSQPEYFDAVFRLLWRELGGTLGRGMRQGSMPPGASLFVWHDSETLSDMIRQVNKFSNNVMARALLLILAAESGVYGATPDSGARVALDLLRRQGVDTRGWVIENGSGLSRGGRLTASGLIQMLDIAWNSPLMPEFVSSLAIAGVDGTVRRRLRNDEARGMAHLKTGTLRDTRAIAGYVLGESGKRYALVSMVNGSRAAAMRAFDDALIRWLSAQ